LLFFYLTPAPPPFSAMNSTPAFLKRGNQLLASVSAARKVPINSLEPLDCRNRDARPSAKSYRDQPIKALAALICRIDTRFKARKIGWKIPGNSILGEL
jgi:hypothetical protein